MKIRNKLLALYKPAYLFELYCVKHFPSYDTTYFSRIDFYSQYSILISFFELHDLEAT